MRLEEITLENFGPFIGNQKIDFRTTEGRPLVIVDAPNGRGKTFIYRAIRWAIYGQVQKGKSLIPDAQLVNSIALGSDDVQMSVSLRCLSDGENIEIVRTLPIDSESRLPTSTRLKVVKDGIVLPQAQSEQLIRDRLDESISRFFFFDGEMLEEYEGLLDEDSSDSQIVRKSVETILGAPALSRLIRALDSSEKAIIKQIETSSRADESLRKLSEAHSKASDKVADLETDIAEQRRYASDFQKEIARLEDELRSHEYARDIFAKISAKEEQLEREVSEVARIREEIQLGLQDWQIALSSVAEKALSVSEPIRDEAFASVAQREDLTARRVAIAEAAESGVCSICHQEISDASSRHLHNELLEIDENLQSVPIFEKDYLEHVSLIVKRARSTIRLAEKASLVEKGRNLEKGLGEIATLEVEIDRLQDMVSEVDQPKIRKIEDRRTDLRRRKTMAQTLITERQRELTEAVKELEKCKRQLSDAHLKAARKGISGGPDLEKKISINDLARGAREVFTDSYDDFVQRLRESVSDSSNLIFESLISDPGYRGLMINKNFGLSLLNEEGQIVDLRSSGQSQVVAVSLILALHECAVRTGTLLMDTPFGRLDLTHRKNLMKFLTGHLPQVVLLIQSGELDEDDLAEWSHFTARRYKLERGSSTAETIAKEV